MDAATIISLVSDVVQDSSYSDDDILGYINKGILEISGRIDIPELRTSDTVTAGTTDNYVSLPSNYQKKCSAVIHVADERRIDKPNELYNYHRFIVRNPVPSGTGGSVSDVAIRGNTLFFDPVPSSEETLRLEYMRKPATLTNDGSSTDEVEAIPPHLQQALLVPFAAKEIFNLIEDGIEGRKVNYESNLAAYMQALGELHLFLGFMDSEPAYIADEWDL